jgi:hypothetical protein
VSEDGRQRGAAADPRAAGPSPAVDVRRRLDPARAVAAAAGEPQAQRAAIETRRYQRIIGGIGLALVVAFSIYLYAHGSVGGGVAAGARLHRFVAPLAGSDINRPANANPRCDAAHPNPHALNVCGRTPLVLDFFVTGVSDCVREVGTLQAVSSRFPGVRFAAVAVRGGARETTTLARSHRWRIPVAYDEDGRVGEVYGVVICPMIELARANGTVGARLIGERWLSGRALAGEVQKVLGGER